MCRAVILRDQEWKLLLYYKLKFKLFISENAIALKSQFNSQYSNILETCEKTMLKTFSECVKYVLHLHLYYKDKKVLRFFKKSTTFSKIRNLCIKL